MKKLLHIYSITIYVFIVFYIKQNYHWFWDIELIGYTYSKNIKIFIKLSFQDNFINHIKHNIFFYYDLVNELSKKNSGQSQNV